MNLLYRLLTLALTPLALLQLQRAAAEHKQRARWPERIGRIPDAVPGRLWIHAASVGEINAAQGLIRCLLNEGEALFVSTMTATGATRCRELFGDQVEHRFAPLDNPFATRRWLARAKPRAGLIIETEIWPELYGRCRQLDIPLILVSARVSASAAARYRRFPRLFGRALGSVRLALTQSQQDAERLRELGLSDDRIQVTGNLKFDVGLQDDLPGQARALQTRWGQRPCWTAGSTRDGEEAILLQAHKLLLDQQPDTLLLLAPRHPNRTRDVAALLDQARLRWRRWDEPADARTQVILVDRMGVLLTCYAASDAAFVGGSLVDIGGHNLLEPALLGRPVLAGPHLQQQSEARDLLAAAGALIQVTSAEALAEQLASWLQNPARAQRTGQAGRQAAESGRGSLDRTIKALRPWLEAAAKS